MKHFALCLLAALTLASVCSAQTVFTGKPQYSIATYRSDTLIGNIVVELYPTVAPMAVENWDSLVAIKFYDSTAFHRVVPGFVIQGGDPASRDYDDRSSWGVGEPDQTTIPAEFSVLNHLRGTLAAARTPDINSATSQFYICVAPQPMLDKKYTIFGRTISGIAVVDTIVSAPRDARDNPYDKISMIIRYIGSNDSGVQKPTLTGPADNAMLTLTKVNFSWTRVPAAILYHLQVSTDSTFASYLLDTTRRELDSFFATSKLPNNARYFWRVISDNGGKRSDSTARASFVLGSAAVAESERSNGMKIEQLIEDASGTAAISMVLDQDRMASLTVSDELGRTVRVPFENQLLTAGEHQLEVNHLVPGVYYARLVSGTTSRTRKIIVK